MIVSPAETDTSDAPCATPSSAGTGSARKMPDRTKERDRDCRDGGRSVHCEKLPKTQEDEHRNDRTGVEERAPNARDGDHDGNGDGAETPGRHGEALLEREDPRQDLRRRDALEEGLAGNLEQAA